MTKLITRNTTIPVKKSETFSTAIDNQESVDIHVVQGERRMASANKSLGVFTLEVPPAPKGEPKIDVTFDINVDGILSVTATESKTGNEQSITIKGSSNLSEKEIDEMIKEAEKFAAIDEEEKEKSELLQEAEIYCERLQKTIDPPHRKPDGQSYTDYHDKKVQFLCEDLRKAIKEKEYDLVKEYLEKVKEVLKNGSEFLYKEG